MKNKKTNLNYFTSGILTGLILVGSGAAGLFTVQSVRIYQANILANTPTIEQQSTPAQPPAPKRITRRPSPKPSPAIISSREVDQIETLDQKALDVLCSFAIPEKPEYNAHFIANENRVEAEAGEDFSTKLYLKNTGTMPWFGDESGCKKQPLMRLGTALERDHKSSLFDKRYWKQLNRIGMLEKRINPGEVATFIIAGKTPMVNDMFREFFQPVIEGVTWLESKEATANLDLYAGNLRGAAPENLNYFRFSGQLSSANLDAEKVIEVDISDQMTYVKLGERVIAQYKSSTGTFKTPTPLGRFKVLNKQELRIGSAKPHYRMPYWSGFTKWGHGFHALPYLANDNGTFWNEALNHIGQRVSHGCIRLLPADAKDLHDLTALYMPIIIHN